MKSCWILSPDLLRLSWSRFCRWYIKLHNHLTIVFVACAYFGVLTPQQRGFYCDDLSIKNKFLGDTISIGCLLFICFVPPVIFFLLVESWKHSLAKCSTGQVKDYRFCLRKTGRIVLDYLLGLLFVIFLTEMLKCLVGELRPHFMDTCNPNISSNCTTHEYVRNYRCKSSFSDQLVKDSFKSFPSGHTSLAFYTAVFLIYYIKIRIKDDLSRLLSLWLQLGIVLWACYCSVSRITDYRHHWWDVLFGGVMGIVFGIATVTNLANKFQDVRPSKTNQNLEKPMTTMDRKSSGPLLSNSSEQKEVDLATMKTMDSNHI